MLKPKGNYIDGRFVRCRSPDTTFLSVAPADNGNVIGEFRSCAASVKQAVAAADAASASWSSRPVEQRWAALRRLKAQLRNRGEDMARLISVESGQPLWEGRAEVRQMVELIDGLIRADGGPSRTMTEARVVARPQGVVAVIVAFPQLALLMHSDAMAAVAAGCTVVCKPSHFAPAVAQLYADLIDEADFPPGVFNLVQGDEQYGQELALEPAVAVVLLSGALSTAKKLFGSMGMHGRPLRALVSDLGTAVVCEDAHVDQAAYLTAIGCCASAGQRCTNTRRVLVHRRLARAFRERLVQLLSEVEIGAPDGGDALMGPLKSGRTRQAFIEHLARLELEQAQLLVGGSSATIGQKGWYALPSVYELALDALSSSCRMDVEGPVLCLAEFEAIEQVERALHLRPARLATAVFTRSDEVLRRLQAVSVGGLVLRNAPTTLWYGDLSFCTRGHAGEVVTFGVETQRYCTRTLTTIDRDAFLDPTTLPPGLPQ